MICVEAQVKETLDKMLPVDQDLVPVCLKRKPEYKGNYIEQVVSKSKILEYFYYFKTQNPLFADIQFDETKIDDFLKNSLSEITEQEEWKDAQLSDEIDTEVESQHNSMSDDEDGDEHLPDLSEKNASNLDYDLSSYLTELPDDTQLNSTQHAILSCAQTLMYQRNLPHLMN